MILGGLISAITPNNTTSTTELTIATPTPSVKNPAPTAKNPTGIGSFDPLLANLVPTLKAEYGSNAVKARPKQTGIGLDYDAVFVNFESHGRMTWAEIRNEGSIEAASNSFKILSTPSPGSGDKLELGSITYFGQQAATVALGHAPTVVQDAYLKGTTGINAGVDNEYIQYDQLFVLIQVTEA